MTTAREEILQRIRTALGPAATADPAPAYAALPRAYTRAASLPRPEILHLLKDRLLDYEAHVAHVTPAEIPAAIAASLTARNNPRMVIPPGLDPTWLPDSGNFTVDDNLSTAQLDTFDGVLTACTVAIAQTGTLILQAVPGQGRRAPTLVPDFHLCIVRAADVVQTVSEALVRLAPTAHLPTTFISGPSATADIEMTRIKGVHGPRFLEVLLVS